MENVYLRTDPLTITNKIVTWSETNNWVILRNKLFSKSNSETWDAENIESISAVENEDYSIKKIVFILTIYSVLLPLIAMYLNSAPEVVEYLKSIVFSQPVQQNLMINLDWDEDQLAVFAKIFLLLFLISVPWALINLLAKKGKPPWRYLSIKLKSGGGIKITNNAVFDIDAQESWEKAVSFGIIPNDKANEKPPVEFHNLVITKDTFSFQQDDPTWWLNLLNSKLIPFKSFKLSDIKKIQEVPLDKTWLSSIGLATTFLALFIPFMILGIWMDFESGGGIDMELLTVTKLVVIIASMLATILLFRYFVDVGMGVIEIELKNGEVLELDGTYNWKIQSKAKQALEEAIKNI